MTRMPALHYRGGKISKLSFLLPRLPLCHHYCEPFGGSAAVLLNREPSPVETYNDIYQEVVMFFRVLRNQRSRLIRALKATPYSRQEFDQACSPADGLSQVEMARRFFIKAEMCMFSGVHDAVVGRWGTSRARSVAVTMANKVDRLALMAERMRRVYLDNREATVVIRKTDTEGTLFYCDPPYPLNVRRSGAHYNTEMTNDDHRELAELLASVEGRVAISGFRGCELMDRLYRDWNRHDDKVKKSMIQHSREAVYEQECLWTNY